MQAPAMYATFVLSLQKINFALSNTVLKKIPPNFLLKFMLTVSFFFLNLSMVWRWLWHFLQSSS